MGLPVKSRLSRLFPPGTPLHLLRAFVDVTVADAVAQAFATQTDSAADGESTNIIEDLLTGFPPESLMTADANSTLGDFGLRGRETIRVIWK